MKKNTLLKAIAIVFLVYVLLTWFIPTGYFNSGSYVKDAITPIGLFDIIRYPIITLTSSVFILTALVVLLIGGFYGVLNKTGVYQKFIEGIVKRFSKKETKFLVITTLLFVTLASLTALNLPLFVMVPMFATVLLLLGYNKITTMLATVGSILVGNVVSTYGFNVAGYVTYFTNDINDSIIYRIILFVLVVALLLFTVIKLGKNKEKAKEEIMLYEKIDSKKSNRSSKPMLIISIIMMLLVLVGMTNWTELFNITFFSDIYTKITEIKISGYPIFTNIIGSIYEMGSWTNYELAFMLVLTTIIIGLVYKVSFKDFCESFKNGVKKMVPVALYVLIANILFLVINTSSTNYTIFPTIANWLFGLTKGFNVITYGFISFIGSIIYNDFPYFLSSVYDPITTNYVDSVSVMGVISQTIHGLVQILAPTSILLVAGLKYFDVDYKEWLKKTFKFILAILLIVVAIITIMALV